MIYLLINLLSIEAGGLLSRPLSRLLKPHHAKAMEIGAGLCVLILGIQGALESEASLLLLLSMVIGGLIGTQLDLQGLFYRLGDFFKRRFAPDDPAFSEGLIRLFLLQAVGAMAILGPLNAALQNDPTLILFKAILDFCSTLIYGTIYGRGVLLAGPLLFIYQTAIYLLAGVIEPFLTAEMIREIGAAGSLLILGIGLDMLDVFSFKSADYLPAVLGPVLYYLFR